MFYWLADKWWHMFCSIISDYLCILGLIAVIGSLDGHQGRSYQLMVEAKDQGTPVQSGTATVIIKVAPIDYYSPVFVGQSQAFEITIPEDHNTGQAIAKVSATDKDQGANGMVSYYITGGDPNQQFSIDASQGSIRVEKSLDYEERKIHYLNITARDRGLLPRETVHLFTVILTDVNDNAPQFEASQIDAYVAENSASGTVVIQALAVDMDTPANAMVEYYVTGNVKAMDKFSIERTTGIVRSQGAIDYEKDAEYQLTLKAINPGAGQSGTTTISVHVTGVNEFVPVFDKEVYQFAVSESASSGFEVGKVSATDEDDGTDDQVFFYLIGNSNMQGFVIDHDTGMVTVSGQVDRESVAQITLDVMAKNGGPIRGNDTATCKVVVVINDANDAPRFTETIYQGSVKENAMRGTTVLQVQAIDNDLQVEFRSFSYHVVGSSDFSVDAATGWVTTYSSLDRETVPLHNITIIAMDTGKPPQTGEHHHPSSCSHKIKGDKSRVVCICFQIIYLQLKSLFSWFIFICKCLQEYTYN